MINNNNKIENCKSLMRILLSQGKPLELAQTHYSKRIYEQAKKDTLNVFNVLKNGTNN